MLRDFVSETTVRSEQLVMPHFVLPKESGRAPIDAMPGIERLGVNDLVKQVGQDLELGIKSVLLFGLAEDSERNPQGSESARKDSAAPNAIRALKKEFGDDLLVISDICLCAYTDHGHCGVLKDGIPDNDPTLPILAQMSLAHAEAGVDLVAPSDMMDGRVAAIRDALDDADLTDVGIMSYAVKFASAYYGPFRDAAASAPGHGDRQNYQMDLRNGREAEREALLDEAEGADMLMVKPALAYLDVIHRVRQTSRLPLAAYNVSGEFSAVKAAAERGWLDEAAVVRENLLAIVRAGADIVITYHAREALKGRWL